MSGSIPEGWSSIRLDDFLEPKGLFDGPFGSSLKSADYTDSGVQVIRLENVTNLAFIREKQTFISEAKYRRLLKHTVVEGDIIVGSFVDGAVRVCVLPQLSVKAIAKADCFCVRTRSDIADRRFVAYQLGTTEIRDSLIEEIHGATRPRITTKQLRALVLRIAPPAEQRRIAAKLEALLEQVNRAKTRLDRVPLILKRLRQAVLAAACSGGLTEVWREKVQPILSFDGTTIPMSDLSEPPLVPESWAIVPMSAVVHRFQYGTSEKANADQQSGVPLLRMGNIQEGHLDLRALKFIKKNRTLNDFLVRPGDVLFNRTNSPELVGKTAVVESNEQMAFASYLIRVRVNPDMVRPSFVSWWLNSPWGRQWARQVRTDGVSQSNINASKLSTMPLPLPSLEEQDEILRIGTELLAFVHTTEARVSSAAAAAESLTQALLTKAFAGELVPTEAELARAEGRSYETAEGLLARVRSTDSPSDAGRTCRPGRTGRRRTTADQASTA